MFNKLAWLSFYLCLVRAPLTVPGHSGTPVIEAKLREGGRGDRQRGWGCGRDIPSWPVTSFQQGQEVRELGG